MLSKRVFKVVIVIVMLVLVTNNVSATSPWWDTNRNFRWFVTVNTTTYERFEKPVEIDINFTQIINGLGQTGTIDENSIRVVETDNLGKILNSSVLFQFDKDSSYDPIISANGTITFIMNGTTPAKKNRYYYIYFGLVGGSYSPLVVTPLVTLTDDVMDEGQLSYKINAVGSTYYFQKQAGGFSSWNDVAGNDWIGWNTNIGSSGKYRGIPNAVYAKEIFHPGFYCCQSNIVSQGPIKIRIRSVNDTKWESIWDIYPRYATMTMTKANISYGYWMLYEGTPGGKLENTDFMYRSNGVKTYLNQNWNSDLVNDEWAYFSDPNIGRSLFIVHHEYDLLKDIYKPCCLDPQNNMTVFGFGRNESSLSGLIKSVPQHFTIGLIDGTDFTQNSKLINSAYKNLTIIKGIAEQYGGNINLSIISSSPVNNPSTTVGTVQTFNIDLNINADIIWKIDGVVVKTEIGITSSYTNSTAGIGTHIVNVTATNGTDIRSKEWTWVVNTNAVNEIRLTYNNSLDRQPSWSPDSQWIAFQSRGSAGWEIKKVKLSDGSITTLPGGAGGIEPAWSPGGTKIAFSRGTNDSTMDVYVMNSDGYSVSKLTNTPEYDEYPDWNSDGSKIVYVSQRSVFNGPKYIAVMNADGSSPVYYNVVGIQPTWSPDGKKIAFKCYLGGSNICTINANGTGSIKQLTFNSGNTHEPDWSPDGSKIAYASSKDGDWEIYVMNADGTNQTKLTSNTVIEDNYPAWSPDGQWIAFSSNRTGNEEIWLMSISGSMSPIFSIISYSPINNPNTTIGTSQTFNIDLNKNTDIIWKIDGAIIKTENGVATSSYSNSTAGIGTHIVNVTATNGTDTRSREWAWTVQNIITDITAVSPNGGENWLSNTVKTINWNYNGNPGSFVKIELLKSEILDSVITPSTPIGNSGTGSYDWSIPSTQTLGNDYKIKITSISESIYTDTSNNNFSISGTVININLGITIKQGSGSVEIFRNDSGIWTSLGNTTTSKTYTVAKGSQLNISAIPTSGYNFEKYVTNSGTPITTNPLVVIQNYNGSLNAYFNTTIINSINITSPNGGENWANGTTKTIRWNYTGNPGTYVNIELLKGDALDSVINSSVSIGSGGIGYYDWPIPLTQTLGNDYKVRISTSDSIYSDISDDNFSIDSVSSILVISPNGGETWLRLATKKIEWNYTGNPGSNVKIELLKGGIYNRLINSSTSIGSNGYGYYWWGITLTQPLGDDYKVRVTSTNNSVYSDKSDNNFTISSVTINVNLGITIKQVSGSVEVFRNDSGIWTSLGNTTTSKTYTVEKGSQLNISAIPASGYNFEKYVTNTGVPITTNPLVVIQNYNGSLNAYFNVT